MDGTYTSGLILRTQTYHDWFLRLISIFCLLSGVSYWIRLVGVYELPLWRFDLMPSNWQILCCTLAVVYPVAACGLWMLSRWGVILWLMAGIGESIAMTYYATEFDWNPAIALTYSLLFVIYIALKFAIFLEKHKKAEKVPHY